MEKQKEKSFILFTSEDPEECFSLSEKVVIMKNHEIQAIGSPMFLKTTYGKKSFHFIISQVYLFVNVS